MAIEKCNTDMRRLMQEYGVKREDLDDPASLDEDCADREQAQAGGYQEERSALADLVGDAWSDLTDWVGDRLGSILPDGKG